MVMKWLFCHRFQVARVSLTEITIQLADFNLGAEYKALCDAAPQSGAVVFFVGLVRDMYQVENIDEHIDYIELQHYAGMTEAQCAEIIDQARERFGFDAVRLVHRVGKLQAGEQIVFVAVASQHRDKAFAAVQFIMDYLKTQATLWKKEVGARGEHWVSLKQKDVRAAGQW